MRIAHSPVRPGAWSAGLAVALFAAVAFAQRPAAGPTPAAAAAAATTTPAAAAARAGSAGDRNVLIDRVIAIVNDEALTQYDINEQTRGVLAQMKAQKVTPPAQDVLEKQLLDRLITERVLMQYAKESGIRVDDTQVERTIARIAQDNKLTPEEFRKAIEREGVTFSKYRDEIRNEMVIQRLREREVEGRVSVSDAEVDLFLATLDSQSGGDVEYKDRAHLWSPCPSRRRPSRSRRACRRSRRRCAAALRRGLRAGRGDVLRCADALQGGNLGWRAPARLPTIFVDPIRSLKPGQYSGVLRSAAGFHIVKLIETTKPQGSDGRRADARAAHPRQGQRGHLGSRCESEDRADQGAHRSRREVRRAGKAQFGGRKRVEGRRARLDLSRRHGARFRGGAGPPQGRRAVGRRCGRTSAGT
jgi:peptidyl-prolyl cis-trans isomerase SurA